MQSDLNFDKVQFANRRAFPIHAEYGADGEWTSTGIGFEEYSRMQTAQRAVAPCRRMETPSWAVNDTQLRELLVEFLEERASNGRTTQTGTLAERLANAQKKLVANCEKQLVPIIDRLCKKLVTLKGTTPLTQETQNQIRRLEQQIENLDTRLRFESKDGGAALAVGVAFYYFRVGLDSVGTAKQLGIKPPHARQIVYRLRQTWAKLERWRQDPSTRPLPRAPKSPKSEARPKRPPQPKHSRQPKRQPVDVERGALLLAQGHARTDAALHLGVTLDRLRFALTKAGLYTSRFQKKNVVGIKEVINRQQTTKERHVAIAEKLATENGGIIPSCGWLRANGFGLTYVFLRKHPDWFAHLPRDRAKPGPKAYPNTFNAERAVRLFRMGMPVSKIALAFGYPPQHGNNRVRAALIGAGVYRAEKSRAATQSKARLESIALTN
jgi:hypothetical protein